MGKIGNVHLIPIFLTGLIYGCSEKDRIDRTDTTSGAPIVPVKRQEIIIPDVYAIKDPSLLPNLDETPGGPLELGSFVRDEFMSFSYSKANPKDFDVKEGETTLSKQLEGKLREHLDQKVRHRFYMVPVQRDTIEPDEENTGVMCHSARGIWFVKVGEELHAVLVDIVLANSDKDASFFARIAPEEDDSWISENPLPSTEEFRQEESQSETMRRWIHDRLRSMKKNAVGIRWAEVYGSKNPDKNEYDWKSSVIKYFVIRPNTTGH